jgi:tetratricopeptide (TPR) repeat protein
MRARVGLVLNLLVPGAGLIMLRRDWLGLTISLLFAVLAQIGVAGLWLMPAVMPRGVAPGALAAAGLVWTGAQWMFLMRWREISGAGVRAELASLCARSSAAIRQRRYDEAYEILRVALTLNDEHPEVIRQWAELMTLMGRFRQARQAWHRLLQLARDEDCRRAATEALASLPSA